MDRFTRDNFLSQLEAYDVEKEIKWEKKRFGNYTMMYGQLNGKEYVKPGKIDTFCGFCKSEDSPNPGYHSYEYENLFGFSSHCKGFFPDRILAGYTGYSRTKH